jgi:hypothetical protein
MTRVRVHFHLTRRTFVISEKVAQGWRVVDYRDRVCLEGCTFVVSAKGRDYCRAKRMRWVHAWAEGTLATCDAPLEGTDVVYNPFTNDGFTDGRRLITRADHASFTVGGGPERAARIAVTRCHGAA